MKTGLLIIGSGVEFGSEMREGQVTEEWRPEAERKSMVEVTIEADHMLRVKAELRRRLLEQYHLMKMASRANLKVGRQSASHKQDDAAERCLLMIWCLDNPMEVVVPTKG